MQNIRAALPEDLLAELADALAAGAVLVVPNHRSSQQLQDTLARWQSRRLGAPVLRVPPIHAVDVWLRDLWQQLALHNEAPVLGWHLLEPAEELLLWRQVLANAPSAAALLNQEGTAATARDTWKLLQHALVGVSDLRAALQLHRLPGALPDDRAIWFEWLQAFTTLCKKRRLLTLGDMLQMLLVWAKDAPDTVRAILPQRILLWGFDAPPRLYASLFEAFAALGISVDFHKDGGHAPACESRVFAELAQECRAAAEWARATVDAHPEASVGIICPDAGTLQGPLARALEQTLGAALPVLPRTLSELPFIATAVRILELNQGACDTLQLCTLLRSPWLAGERTEADARALLEFRLRRHGELQTSLANFRAQCLNTEHPTHCPQLGNALLQSEDARRRHKERQPVAAWLELFKQQWSLLLDLERLHTSGDRLQYQGWHLLQEKIAASAFIAEPCTLLAARNYVATLARETMTAGASGASRVQLLGPVASAGLRFTHLWSMQMVEQHWPGDSHPSPWLPLDLQKTHKLPGADPQQTLLEAQNLLMGLTTSTSTELVFSHALFAEGLPQRPSRLLPALHTTNMPPTTAPVPAPAANLHPAVQALGTAQTVPLQDLLVLPVLAEAHGPGALLADQARCPFRAFAVHRLHVTELQPLRYGLTPAAVGQLVHRALEYFWQTLRSSRQLLATDDDELQRILDAAIGQALRETARHYPYTMTPRYQAVQHAHLLRLLNAWLGEERRRGHFTVLDNEESLHWRFERLELRLRIDRIDRAEDGSTVVVDYKTGRIKGIDWQDARQQDTQLLLYQQAVEDGGRYPAVSALLYARVNLEEVGYSGIGADDNVLSGIAFSSKRGVDAPDWFTLKRHWQQTLQLLAQEYLDGYASVQPKSVQSCNNCHVHPFCRIAETGGGA
jgi:ATP-dependent helicase/nuclease subunit B